MKNEVKSKEVSRVVEAPKKTQRDLVGIQADLANWENKDRLYKLARKTPWLKLRSRGVKVWDEVSGKSRMLKYSKYHPTPFTDEQEGRALAADIIFEHGWLDVPKEDKALQLFLHFTEDKDKWFTEYVAENIAEQEVNDIETEAKALSMALDLDIDTIESIARDVFGSDSASWKNAELKREVLLFAKADPTAFIETVKDTMLPLRNAVHKSIDLGLIKLADRGRSIVWGANDKLLVTIPFGEDYVEYVAKWFTSDEGQEVLNEIAKKLK